MKFKAKPLWKDEENEFLAKELKQYIDDNGYICGWYVDGAIVGKFVEFNEEYTVNEFWCKIDLDTLEVVE